MIWVELAIVLLFIFIGARIGGIGIGLAGGAGVIALSLILGVPTKQAFIPVDVILIIMSVITAIAAMLVPFGVDYLTLLAICIPTTFAACMVGAFVANFMGSELKDDPIYQERLAQGLIKLAGTQKREILPTAKTATYIFLTAIILVVCYAAAISNSIGLIENPALGRNEAIMTFMLAAAAGIVLLTKIDAAQIPAASTFRSGMTACVCVLGVAWLGSTFVNAHVDGIKEVAGTLLADYPWMLALVLFFASMLLYSQGATTVALMPAALAIGVAPLTAVASFAAVSALFVLPTYPTLLAAVEMDDTGSTRIGSYVFNHPFFIPGVVTIASAVAFGFLFGSLFI